MQHKNKKIGFYGGTFDPLHNGHIHLALEVLERWGLNEIWFNPASCSPFKVHNPPLASYEDRYAMLQLALKKYPQFRVLDLEKGKTEPVYTIDAILDCIQKENISAESLYLLLSDDALSHFSSWKEARRLALLAQPIIGMRKHEASLEELLKPYEGDPVLYERFKKGMTLMPILEISSTNIRERIRNKQACSHLIPREIEEFIQKHHLYLRGEEHHQHFQKQTISL